MTDDSKQPGDRARAAFLSAYQEDLDSDALRSLEEYQALFPGFEQEVFDEWCWLEPESVADDGQHGSATVPEQVQDGIGPYRILHPLGSGAQAVVYLAEHEETGRPVALKVLHVEAVLSSPQHMARFRREARITAAIDHPGICSVLDSDLTTATPWIAMERVRGRTLGEHLADRGGAGPGLELPAASGEAADPVGRVLRFLELAARAVHVAHGHGLVHRDIKPGNLMVAEDGRPVLLDFGLARADDGLQLTRTSDMLGTPYYLAPEQLRDAGADARTDVYALGVTLYECVSGRRPFEAATREALFQQILGEEPPPVRRSLPELPRDLEVVLLTALSKDRDRRYVSALELAEDLRRVRVGEPIRARRPGPVVQLQRWMRRNPQVASSMFVALVALITGLVVSVLALGRTSSALEERGEAVSALQGQVDRLYGVLSSWRGHAAQLGAPMPRQQEYESLALDILERVAPGARALILSTTTERLRTPDSAARGARSVAQLLFDAYREDLGVIERLCLADRLSEDVAILLASGRGEIVGSQELAAWAALVRTLRGQADQPTGARDARTVRDVSIYLDVLLMADRGEEVLAELERQRVDGSPEPTSYELRQVRAWIALGRLEEAATRLHEPAPDSSVPGVSPDSLERALALVELHDALGHAQAASAARHDLALEMQRADRHDLRLGRVLFADRPGVQRAFTDLLDASTGSEDELLIHLEALRTEVDLAGLEQPGPEVTFLAGWVRRVGDTLQRERTSDVVLALCELAFEWSAPRPGEVPVALYAIAGATLGNAFSRRNAPARAEPMFRAAIDTWEEIDGGAGIAWIMRGNLGQCLMALGTDRHEEARALLESAIRGLAARSAGASDANMHAFLGDLLRLDALAGEPGRGFALAHERLVADRTWECFPEWLELTSWGVVRVPEQDPAAYRLAVEAMREAVASEAGTWELQRTLALAEYRTGHPRQALGALERCLELRSLTSDAPSVQVLALRALVQESLGRIEEARADLERAVELVNPLPSSAESREALALVGEANLLGLKRR